MQENEDVLDINEFNTAPAKRPVFLTVLCILTYVGTGIGLISVLIAFSSNTDVEESMRAMEGLRSTPFSSDFQSVLDIDIEKINRTQSFINILGLCTGLACLAGALLMWNLKKIGYYIYLLGHVSAITAGYFTMSIFDEMNTMSFGLASMMGVLTFVFILIFSAAFIIMYGVNFKHLK
jgi:hypothetical protein